MRELVVVVMLVVVVVVAVQFFSPSNTKAYAIQKLGKLCCVLS